jgi:cobalt-zinc-cadmium resistance protein CzcA
MLQHIVQWSLRNRFLVLVLTAVVVALGVSAARTLPIDAVPDITNVQVQILTKAPALGPLEVERFVTVPVERSMSGLPQVTDLRSVSKFGLSQVTVVFEDDADIYRARQLVAERLQEARDVIPEGYGHPRSRRSPLGLARSISSRCADRAERRWSCDRSSKGTSHRS